MDSARWATPLHAEIERLGAQYLSTGNLSDTKTFRGAIASLASMYKRYISVEESVVFSLSNAAAVAGG